MNNYTYKQISHHGVLQNIIHRIQDNTFIPFDPANTDYQAYLQWLAEGNEPEPADEPEQPTE